MKPADIPSIASAPRTYSSIEKIRADAAAAISDAARELVIGRELAPVLSQRSSGRPDGSITVRREYGWCGSKAGGYMTAR